MTFHRDVIGAIGRTPLIRLRAASEATGCTILGKAEFMNPGGSVKDRAALAIIGDAVARGALRTGGSIVEGTAGNTGIGIAMVASALGYRAVIVIPDTQSQEKKDMLRMAGAELIEVPAVPYSNQTTTSAIPAVSQTRLRRPNRKARSGRTSSTTSPIAADITKRPARRFSTTWRGTCTASSARSVQGERLRELAWR